AKAAATQYSCFTAQQQKASITTLRLYSVFGPAEDPKRLMPTLTTYGRKGRLPPLVNPESARDYVYIDDVCDAYLLAASTRCEPGAIYNVGTGVQTTLRQVVEVARRVLNLSAEPVWGSMPDRAWDTNVWVADPSKIRRELGWNPKDTFE